jgi:hypothetical protein
MSNDIQVQCDVSFITNVGDGAQVRGNLHMVSEVINECMDYGIVTQLKQHVVLDRIHSKYLAPKPSMLDAHKQSAQRASHFRCDHYGEPVQRQSKLRLNQLNGVHASMLSARFFCILITLCFCAVLHPLLHMLVNMQVLWSELVDTCAGQCFQQRM